MLPRPLRPPPYPPRPGCGGFFASCGKRGRPRTASVLAALLLAASQAPAGQPPGILIAGNSYSYYSCGVDEVLRGLMRETRPRLRSEVTLEAVRGGAVAAHPLPQLLRSRGGLPGPGIVILQGNSAAAAAGHSGFYRRGVLVQAEAARRFGPDAKPA